MAIIPSLTVGIDTDSSDVSEDELETDVDSDLSDFDKDFYEDDEVMDAADDALDIRKENVIEETGLKEHELYRCGNLNCNFTASNPSDFKDHILNCVHSDPLHHFSCFHCGEEHNHLQSLLEHLKTHSLRRYLCSLCDFKDPLMINVKNHVKSVHKLTNFKFVPVNSAKTNPDKDYFMAVPKNNLQKTVRSKIKDTFSPEDISSIPAKPDIYKYILRCNICDYGTRVKNNLVKHLKLHLKQNQVPVVTPVNPPPVEDATEPSALSRMTSLLPDDIDEEMKRKPLTFEELAKLPSLVPENLRY